MKCVKEKKIKKPKCVVGNLPYFVIYLLREEKYGIIIKILSFLCAHCV